jgi:hypothetical protein
LVVEGTSGFAGSNRFREQLWMAALQDESHFGAAHPASSFVPTYRTVATQSWFPGFVRHELATRGVRVEQVGVKPSWRAVVAVGVVEFVR